MNFIVHSFRYQLDILLIIFFLLSISCGICLAGTQPDTIKLPEFFSLPLHSVKTVKIDNKSVLKKVFSEITPLEIKNNNTTVKIKAIKTDTNIYISVEFPDTDENSNHLLWHWDAVTQSYKRGTEKEDTICLFLSVGSPTIDMWIWRSARTNPAGYADDFYLLPYENKTYKVFADKGKLSWFGKYFSEFAGVTLQRFYQQRPTESQADVHAEGQWKNNKWKIIFYRKLDTGHPNDVKIDKNIKLISIALSFL